MISRKLLNDYKNAEGIKRIDGVRVKNASLFLDKNKNEYHLVHYDTTILVVDVDTKEVKLMLPVSNSSSRAITQAYNALGIEEMYYETLKRLDVNVTQLRKEWKPKVGGSNYSWAVGVTN